MPCPHGRQRSLCKACGGIGICEHGRQRNRCKECGGSSLCEHGRRRSDCKECGGASICEHGRDQRRCKDCACAKAGGEAKVTDRKRKRKDTEKDTKRKRKDTDKDTKRKRKDTWVACDKCAKWRMLPAGSPAVGGGKWSCAMNPDARHNTCRAPEQRAQ